MKPVYANLNMLREHLNILKLNIPYDIRKELNYLENRYINITKNNNNTNNTNITDNEKNVEYWLYTTYLNACILLQNLKFKCFITE